VNVAIVARGVGVKYMVVDPRRDHSFRVPRPDISVLIGTPNACTDCHKNRSASWAATAVKTWYGRERGPRSHFALALDAGRRGLPDAERRLTALVTDADQPAIARATALGLLREFLSAASLPALEAGLRDENPHAETLAALLPSDGAVQAQRSELAQLVRPPSIPSGKDRPQTAPTR
jgi:hypothetical protein